MGFFSALLWPLTQLLTLAAHPFVWKPDRGAEPLQGFLKLWNPVRRVLAPLAWPLVGLRATGLGLRVAAPDASRSLQVWRHILPIFSMYVWTNWSSKVCCHVLKYDQAKVEARWDKRHKWGGKRVFNMVTKVQGYYVKTGQILASKREFIPAAWAEQLGCLWDASPPTRSGWRNVAKALEACLKRCPSAVRLVSEAGGKGGKGTEVVETVELKKRYKNGDEASRQQEQAHNKSGSGDFQQNVASATSSAPHEGAVGHAAGEQSTGKATPVVTATSSFRRLMSWRSTGRSNSVPGAPVNPSTAPATDQTQQQQQQQPPSTGEQGTGEIAPARASSSFRRLMSWRSSGSNMSMSTSGAPAPRTTTDGAVDTSSSLPEEQCKHAQQQKQQHQALAGESSWAAWTFSWFNPVSRFKSTGQTSALNEQEQQAELQAEEQYAAANTRLLKFVPRHVGHVFRRVDATPLASASIAQVHSAVLRPEVLQLMGDSWSHSPEVVIKVQHRHVRRLISTDLRNMQRIAKFLSPTLPFDLLPILREMQRVVPLECDFEREERLMSAIRARLAASQINSVCVPQAVQGLCGPGLIVMQRMRGLSLTSLLKKAADGNQAAKAAGARCLLPVLHAYGQMMLVDGLFHADPHPGNMLLQADGRVALLDWGQVKALTAKEREVLCELYRSLGKKDVRAALKAAEFFGLEIGSDAEELEHLSLAQKRQQALKMLTIMFDTKYMPEGSRYSFGGSAVVEGAPLQKFPGDLYLICRAVFILRGLCNMLGLMDVSTVDIWSPFASAGLSVSTAVSEARAKENAMLTKSTIQP